MAVSYKLASGRVLRLHPTVGVYLLTHIDFEYFTKGDMEYVYKYMGHLAHTWEVGWLVLL